MGKLEDLIAKIKIDVSVRRTRSGGVAIDSTQIRAKTAREASIRDPALRSLYLHANAKAKELLSADPYAGWTEVATVSLVQSQICRACGESPLHIVGEFLKLAGYAQIGDTGLLPIRTSVLVRRPAKAADLPHEVQHLASESVALCGSCATNGEIYDKVIDAVDGKIKKQLRLFS